MRQPIKSKQDASKFAFYVFMFYMLVVYSGLPDYVTPLRAIKPGLLCVILLTIKVLVSGSLSKDIKETEVLMLFLIIGQSFSSFMYANNTGVMRHLLEAEILNIFGLTLGVMLAIRSENQLRIFLKIWLFLGVLISAQVIKNGGVGPQRLGDENDVTLVVVLILPFFLLGVNFYKGFYKWLCATGILLSFVAIVAATSRGGFLALLGMLVMLWLFSRKKLAWILTAGLVVSLAAAFFMPQQYKTDMSTISDTKESTADARLYSWILGFEIFKDNLFLGAGTGQYGWEVSKYQRDRGDFETDERGLKKRRDLSGRTSHSLYVDYISERGLVGLVFVSIMAVSIYQRLKLMRAPFSDNGNDPEHDLFVYFSIAASCGIVGNLVGSIFVTSFYFPSLWLMVGWVIATHRIVKHKRMDAGV